MGCVGKKDLIRLVLTYAGSFDPRFIRGSTTTLSNHAFGSAFDINAEWNPLGHTPAPKGTEGSVRELVPIAHEYGFYWEVISRTGQMVCTLRWQGY